VICGLFFGAYSAKYAEAAVLMRPPNNLGLVGYWSFNEGTSTIAGDFSGNGNNGILTAMANPPTATSGWTNQGKRGGALNFDGVNDYVDLNPSLGNGLDIPGPFTVSAWTKTLKLGVHQTIVSKHNNGSDANYLIWIDDLGYFQVYAAPGGISTDLRADSLPVQVNTWYHVVEVWDGSLLRLYVNGIEPKAAVSGSGAVVVTTKQVAIGRSSVAGNNPHTGLIDDVRIYNRALSAAEVKALYQSGAAAINSSQNNRLKDGLVGLWSFNGGDMNGNTAYDRSGNNNNGTLTNGPTRAIGKIGQALSFDGADDYVDVGTGPSVKGLAQYTISMWIRPSSFPINANPYGEFTNAGTHRIILTMEAATSIRIFGKALDGDAAGNFVRCNSGFTLVANNWYHIVAIFDSISDIHSIYLMGSLCNSNSVVVSAVSNTVPSASIKIGSTATPSSYFPGLIDDVRVYNRALTPEEVKQLYLMGK